MLQKGGPSTNKDLNLGIFFKYKIMHQQGGKTTPIGKCEYVFAVLLGEVCFSSLKLVLFPSLTAQPHSFAARKY